MTPPSSPGARLGRLPAWGAWAVAVLGVAVLVASCFGSALWGGRQFAFRDTKHFYYPLHLAIQRQWDAGIVPLWSPGEDGGIPLAGSPQAAVFYPGKLIFAVLPFPWATRLYVVAHVLLAAATLRVMLRSWGVSSTGSTLGGLAYAFSAPVLCGTSNLIFLVGSAWAPIGFRASDGWLRLGRRWSLVELAVVLMMQATGGDLEAAYVTAVCAGGYALILGGRRGSVWGWALGSTLVVAAWAVVAPALASRPFGLGPGAVRVVVGLAWVVGLSVALGRGIRGRERSPVGSRLLGLAAAGVLAIGLGAIQFAPIAVNLVNSGRWGEAGASKVEVFSFEPYRVLEAVCPDLFGSMLNGERLWLLALPPVGGHMIWTLSFYLGVLPVVLAVGVAGFRAGPPWQRWLWAVALVCFLAACGSYFDPSVWLGLRAGGSLYRFFATILPGFGGFRYPSKLLAFVCLAVAGLAGAGWDRVVLGRERRSLVAAGVILLTSGMLLVLVGLTRVEILRLLARSSLAGSASMFGPFDPKGVWISLLRSLGQSAVASAVALAVIVLARPRPGPQPRSWIVASMAGGLAVLAVAVDLAVANSALIFTLPQSDFDRPSAAAEIIQAAEAAQPSSAPVLDGEFRIFRLAPWAPDAWFLRPSSAFDRMVEVARWEHDTLLPNVELAAGLSSTLTESGVVEKAEFEAFFQPYTQRIDARVAGAINAQAGGQEVLCYPRQAFDLWGTRYFLLPTDPGDWTRRNRALISFLDATEPIDPGPRGSLDSPLADFQIRRNRNAFPRAWVVRDFLGVDPAAASAAETLRGATRHLARGTAAGIGSSRFAFDPHTTALIEATDLGALAPYRSTHAIEPSESPRIVRNTPSLVELEVTTRFPRLVVLADRFDPGWEATVDGQAAPILKANALMRAVGVAAGSHRIVFRYAPISFRVGVAITLVSLGVLGLACAWARRGSPAKP